MHADKLLHQGCSADPILRQGGIAASKRCQAIILYSRRNPASELEFFQALRQRGILSCRVPFRKRQKQVTSFMLAKSSFGNGCPMFRVLRQVVAWLESRSCEDDSSDEVTEPGPFFDVQDAEIEFVVCTAVSSDADFAVHEPSPALIPDTQDCLHASRKSQLGPDILPSNGAQRSCPSCPYCLIWSGDLSSERAFSPGAAVSAYTTET